MQCLKCDESLPLDVVNQYLSIEEKSELCRQLQHDTLFAYSCWKHFICPDCLTTITADHVELEDNSLNVTKLLTPNMMGTFPIHHSCTYCNVPSVVNFVTFFRDVLPRCIPMHTYACKQLLCAGDNFVINAINYPEEQINVSYDQTLCVEQSCTYTARDALVIRDPSNCHMLRVLPVCWLHCDARNWMANKYVIKFQNILIPQTLQIMEKELEEQMFHLTCKVKNCFNVAAQNVSKKCQMHQQQYEKSKVAKTQKSQKPRFRCASFVGKRKCSRKVFNSNELCWQHQAQK